MRAPSTNVRQHSGALGAYCSHSPKGFLLADCLFEVKNRKSLIERRFSVVKVDPSTSGVRRISRYSPTAGPPKNIDKESDLSNTEKKQPVPKEGPAIRTTGVRGVPQAGGIKNATLRYDLPPPAVAVRNLVEQAQIAHLCTIMSNMHHRRAGYPFGTIVDFASDGAGFPIFALSALAIHTRNLMEDPRCCLVVQMPGWTGLANARVTIFGDVYQLPPELQPAAQEVFVAKQSVDGREKWAHANTVFFRMHKITDIYFVGGFGTMTWVNVSEYAAAKPDRIATQDARKTLQVLNDKFGGALRDLLSREGGLEAEEAALISIDQLGLDIRVRHAHHYSIQRLPFQQPVQTLEDAITQVQRLVS